MRQLTIDGSQGEGGGQILRSSLTLAALTQTAVEIVSIRAGRRKAGLLRQHLAAVQAAAAVSRARVGGAELGSQRLVFVPGAAQGGRYAFAVGTAGSATLVCQTVLPILLTAGQPSELEFFGGTHNPMAPPYDFLEQVYFPVLRHMGAEVSAELVTAGFYPAGGGRFRVSVGVGAELRALELLEREPDPALSAWTVSSRVPGHVAQRELQAVRDAFGLEPSQVRQLTMRSPGPGNALCIRIGEDVPELVTAFGEKGRRAEEVAEDAVAQARSFLAREVPVGEHLADQLILLCVLTGGLFRTGPLSSHGRTNIDVVRRFLGSGAVQVTDEERGVQVRVNPVRGS